MREIARQLGRRAAAVSHKLARNRNTVAPRVDVPQPVPASWLQPQRCGRAT